MKLNRSTFFSDGLIEGWTSLIWTERHKELGDFQFKTPYVDETMAKLPLGSVVAINSSDEVCFVESQSITQDDKGARELTVSGRSLEVFLSKRALTGPYQEPWMVPGTYTAQDAVMMYIWNHIVNTKSYEIIRDYYWDHLPRHIIPNVAVSDSVKPLKAVVGAGTIDDLQTTQEWWFQNGAMDTKVNEILTLANLGIRIIRPRSHNAKIITDIESAVPGNYAWYRVITKAVQSTCDKLRFDIYNGRNRTLTSATDTPLDINEPVIFSYEAGHIDTPSYLFTIKDSYTGIHFQSPFNLSVDVYRGETGLDYMMEWAETPPVDDSLSTTDLNQWITDLGLSEWKRKKPLRLVDGGITAAAPWEYGVDYYLGDIVNVAGAYSSSGKKMVSEYIRTQDASGEKAYPTLIDPP